APKPIDSLGGIPRHAAPLVIPPRHRIHGILIVVEGTPPALQQAEGSHGPCHVIKCATWRSHARGGGHPRRLHISLRPCSVACCALGENGARARVWLGLQRGAA